MDFDLDDAQREVQGLARKILGDLCTNERRRLVEAGEEGWDRSLWRELARANLLGVGLPEAWGGSDLGFLGVCVLLGRSGARSRRFPCSRRSCWVRSRSRPSGPTRSAGAGCPGSPPAST
jgi:acyl-CoA dehydrogenase